MNARQTVRLFLTALALVLFGGTGCDDSPGVGEKGGACRLGYVPCDDDLLCYQGECTVADDVPAQPITEENFSAEIEITTTHLLANGEDSLILSIDLRDRKTGQPTSLPGVLVRTHPINAGRLSPQKLALDKGHGVVELKACNKMYQACPREFRIVMVTIEFPTVPIYQSPEITYDDVTYGTGDAAPPDANLTDATVTDASTADAFVDTDALPSGDAFVTPPVILTEAEVLTFLDRIQMQGSDCDVFAARQTEGPARDQTKEVCLACQSVWSNGGGVLAAGVVKLQDGMPAFQPLKIARLSNFMVEPTEDPLNPLTLTAAAGPVSIRIPYVPSHNLTGCGAEIEGATLAEYFGTGCTSLSFARCAHLIAGPLEGTGRQVSVMLIDSSDLAYCRDAAGARMELPDVVSQRLYMCINTFTR